jgi:recombinational DNA repair ATPase RecF
VHLKSFQIQNFRSINDSGEIHASRITALLGRNESGKSNLLRVLHALNPAEGFTALNPIKDFPRHRKLAECTDETPVVATVWKLDSDEQAKHAEIWPRAQGVSEVRVGRRYGPKSRWVDIDVPESTFNVGEVRGVARKIDAAVKAKAAPL